jgi:hypothetical protein
VALVAPSPKVHAQEVTCPPVLAPVNFTDNGAVPVVCDAEIVTSGGFAGTVTEIAILLEFDPPGPVAVTAAVYVPTEVYV